MTATHMGVILGAIASVVLASGAVAQDVAPDATPAANAVDALTSDYEPTSPSPIDHVLGLETAPHTLVLYTSMICKGCSDWHFQVLPELKRTYIDTGQVRLVFRNVPVDPVEYTGPSAALALCAPPETFFAVVDVLMQGEAAVRAGGPVDAWYDPAIAASGRTREDMEACVSNQATLAALNAEIAMAVEAGVTRAPTVVVDGILVIDATFENIKSVIDAIPPDRLNPIS